MNAEIRHKLPRRDERMAEMPPPLRHGSTRVMTSFIGGTAVWVIYFMFVYALTSLTCYWGWFMTATGEYGPGLKTIQVVATVIAVALNALLAFLAYGDWQHTRTEQDHAGSETIAARTPMLAFVALLLNALYILIILVSLVPIFVLPACKP
jgi:hypothetical protein